MIPIIASSWFKDFSLLLAAKGRHRICKCAVITKQSDRTGDKSQDKMTQVYIGIKNFINNRTTPLECSEKNLSLLRFCCVRLIISKQKRWSKWHTKELRAVSHLPSPYRGVGTHPCGGKSRTATGYTCVHWLVSLHTSVIKRRCHLPPAYSVYSNILIIVP